MRYDDIYDEISAGSAGEALPEWALGVLDGIAGGRRPVAAVRHPLGFLCLPLERDGGRGVCLHLWSPKLPPAPATTSPVHCHSWDLISFVLYGTVRNVRAALIDRPDDGRPPATHRVFEVVSHGEVDELRPTARTVRYAPGDDTEHGAGETYTLPAGVFHSTQIPGDHMAATVALGRHTPRQGDLSLGPLDLPAHQVRRTRYPRALAARAARDSADHLAAPHPRRS